MNYPPRPGEFGPEETHVHTDAQLQRMRVIWEDRGDVCPWTDKPILTAVDEGPEDDDA